MEPRILISTIKVGKHLADESIRFLANMVDKMQETKLKPKDVLVVKEFVEVFLEDMLGLHSRSN